MEGVSSGGTTKGCRHVQELGQTGCKIISGGIFEVFQPLCREVLGWPPRGSEGQKLSLF